MGNRISSFTDYVLQEWVTLAASEKKLRASFLDDVCVICIDDSDDKRTTLQCGHRFHTECVKTWMETRQTCPLCRQRDSITFPPISCFANCRCSSQASTFARPSRRTSQMVYNGIQSTDTTPTILTYRSFERLFENELRDLENTLNERLRPPPFIGPITLQDAIARRNLQIENGTQRMMTQNIFSPPRRDTENDDDRWEQLEPIL